MIDTVNPTELQGLEVIGGDGTRIGKIENIYLDNETGKPEWAAVATGMFGTKVSLVPLAQADRAESGLQVPYDKGRIKDAPHVDADRELSTEEEAALFEHYGVPYGGETVTAQVGDGAGSNGRQADTAPQPGVGDEVQGGTVGHDTSGPTTDRAMTRSEEQLHVGTEQVEAGRARLRKYVTTENVTQTVPVTREEVRVEREPITEANAGAATDGPTISEEEHEVVLHEERPVVQKEAVPVERVRLGTESVSEERQVTDEVRKEQIDTDGVHGA